jgi:putative ABC transport system ATP-binding protein
MHVEGICKQFGEGAAAVRALSECSLSIHPSELTLMMGPSGSGKTTLLSIMGCILRPTSGAVRVAGHDAEGLSESGLAELRLRHIGFVFQGYNLFPTLTAAENVAVALALLGKSSRRGARREAEQALAEVGLEAKANTYPKDLSGGQKQRVAIARALVGGRDIVLADEPTAALDSSSGRNVLELLQRLARERGCTVVVVTHDPRALPYADRIVSLEDGRIVVDDAGDSLSNPTQGLKHG